MKKRTAIVALVGTALVASTAMGASPALANAGGYSPPVAPGTPTVLASTLVSPLSLEVDPRGTVYASENFTGQLAKIDSHGTVTTIVSAPGQEISAVSSRRGTVYYAQVAQDHSSATLMAKRGAGASSTVADLHAYEASANPDGVNTYGFVGLPASCASQIDPTIAGPASYTGAIDTHPYATLALGSGIYVADAGANAILRVGYSGRVSTVAVLPAGDPVTVSAKVAAANGFPTCVVGYKYRFEPVPTDVELGPDGWLYVTSLPGGPEDTSLGARGVVYRVNPWNGRIVKVASGLAGATGLAVSMSTGTIYVSELFGGAGGTGQVSVIDRRTGAVRPLIALNQPTAIELRANRLYVSTDSLAEGPTAKITVVPLTSKHSGWREDSSGDDN